MLNHQPYAQDLAARIIETQAGTTALHQAAQEGTLQNLCGVTAEFLANVKNDYGWTPLDHAAREGYLDQIPGINAELLATVKPPGPGPQGPALFSSNPRANTRA